MKDIDSEIMIMRTNPHVLYIPFKDNLFGNYINPLMRKDATAIVHTYLRYINTKPYHIVDFFSTKETFEMLDTLRNDIGFSLEFEFYLDRIRRDL